MPGPSIIRDYPNPGWRGRATSDAGDSYASLFEIAPDIRSIPASCCRLSPGCWARVTAEEALQSSTRYYGKAGTQREPSFANGRFVASQLRDLGYQSATEEGKQGYRPLKMVCRVENV